MKIVKTKNKCLILFFIFICTLSCKKHLPKIIEKRPSTVSRLNFQLDSVGYLRLKEYDTKFKINGVVVCVTLSKIYYKNNGKHEIYIDDNNGFSKGFILPFNFNDLAPDGISITNKLLYNNKKIENGFVVSFWYCKIFADYVFINQNGNYYLKEIVRYCQGPLDVYSKQTDTLYTYSNKIFNQPIDKLSKTEIDSFINKDWDSINLNYILKQSKSSSSRSSNLK